MKLQPEIFSCCATRPVPSLDTNGRSCFSAGLPPVRTVCYPSLSNRSSSSFLYSDFRSSSRKLMSINFIYSGLARSIFLKIFSCCFFSSLQVSKAVVKSLRLIFFFFPFRVSARSSSSAGWTSAVATMSYPGASTWRLPGKRSREKFSGACRRCR